jgi:hypothetical protein
MSGADNKPKDSKSVKPPVINEGAKKRLPPPSNEEDDSEDSDMATPKRDRDDEQQGL